MKPPSEPLRITSPHNKHVKRWRRLLDPAGMKHFQQFLLFGKKVVQETLEKWPHQCVEIVFSSHGSPNPIPSSLPSFILNHNLFQELDCFGTQSPLLVCRVPYIPTINLEERPYGLEVLCPLGDPANMGALIRSCVAFGVQNLILLREAVHPCHPRSVRAASGMVFDLPIRQGPSIHEIQKFGGRDSIIGLDLEGENLSTFQWPTDCRILVGEEGPGIPGIPLCSTVAIPMAQARLSLNATVAASIAMYAYRLQHPL